VPFTALGDVPHRSYTRIVLVLITYVLRFPCLKVFRPLVEERQAPARTLLFLFNGGMKVVQSRTLPTLVLIARKAVGLSSQNGVAALDVWGHGA